VPVADNDFQGEVLAKLVQLEAKMNMLFGSYQPGRMKLAEDRIQELTRNGIRRSVYGRLLNAGIGRVQARHEHGNRWRRDLFKRFGMGRETVYR
jgi:hypothetical protein